MHQWIVPFCKGLDVIQQAHSATGKMATFCSGVLQQLDYDVVKCQVLVLAPTRELAWQIEKVIRALGEYVDVEVHVCVGGTVDKAYSLWWSSCCCRYSWGRVFDMRRRQ